MLKKIILFLLAVFLITNSCRKKVTEVEQDYVGYWTEKKNIAGHYCYMTLMIRKDGYAYYNSRTHLSDCSYFTHVSGKTKTNNKSMRIGLRTFDIQLPPVIIDTLTIEWNRGSGFITGKTNMKMVFENDTLYKIIGE